MISNVLFSFTNLCIIVRFLDLFSTAVNAELVAKPLILGILLSISLILALESVF